jgi:hypothetical protein
MSIEDMVGYRIKFLGIADEIKEFVTEFGVMEKILVICISTTEGEVLADDSGRVILTQQLFNYGKRFQSLNIQMHDIIAFDAKVEHKDGRYQLVNPNNIEILPQSY